MEEMFKGWSWFKWNQKMVTINIKFGELDDNHKGEFWVISYHYMQISRMIKGNYLLTVEPFYSKHA